MLTNNNPISIGGSFTFGGSNPLNLGAVPFHGRQLHDYAQPEQPAHARRRSHQHRRQWHRDHYDGQQWDQHRHEHALNLGGFNLANTGTTTGVTDVINGSANVNITGPIANGGSGKTA